jgi:hypothetical protein
VKNKDKSEEGNTDNTDDGDSAAGDGNSHPPVAPENTGTPDATDASSNVPTPDTSTDESLAVPESTDPSEQISGSGE